MEHRWSHRRPLDGAATLSHPRYGLIRGIVRDISIGGMFVETGCVELPINTPVTVSFRLQNEGESDHYRLHAMVVRATDRGAGLMYLDSSAETIRPLRQMLYGGPAAAGVVAADALPAWPDTGRDAITSDLTGVAHG